MSHAELDPRDPVLLRDPAEIARWAAPEPTERPDVWPAHTRRGRNCGKLKVNGVALSDLARTQESPLFVLDLADFDERCRNYQREFERAFAPLAGAQVHYAGKAFISTEIARRAAAAGLGLDTASAGEMATALASGAPRESIGLHGNGKSPALLAAAVRAGIGRIIMDSVTEVARLGTVLDDLATQGQAPEHPIPVMLRLTTGVHAGGHEFIATAHEDQKFGLSLHDTPAGESPALQAARAVLADKRLALVGLHSHIGSQIIDLSGFAAAARRVLQWRAELEAKTGVRVDELDLGGGYGVAYTGQAPVAPTIAQVAAGLAQTIKETCDELGQPYPHISIEPGRSIAAPTTVTAYTVTNIKDQVIGQDEAGREIVRRYVSVNGGMSDNIRPVLYDAQYTAALANRRSSADLQVCRVVGSHCESGDIVLFHVALPADLREGDVLAVPMTGAYGHSMASNYNLFTRPGVLGLEADGTGHWLVRPETVEEMLAFRDPAFQAATGQGLGNLAEASFDVQGAQAAARCEL